MQNIQFHFRLVRVFFLLLISISVLSCSKSKSNPAANVPLGPIDQNLVAHWKQSDVSTIEVGNDPNGTGSTPSSELINWIFYADGTYTQEYFNQSSLGCTIVVYGDRKGKWYVGTENGGTLYTEETSSHIKATNDCNSSENTDRDVELRKIHWAYKVSTDADGKPLLTLTTSSGPDIFYQ